MSQTHQDNDDEVIREFYLQAAKIKRGIENIINLSTSLSSSSINTYDIHEEKEITNKEKVLSCKYHEVINEVNQLKLKNFSLQQENDNLRKVNNQISNKMIDHEKKIESLLKLCEIKKNENQLLNEEKEKISRDSKSFHQYLQSLQETEKLLNQNQQLLDEKKKSLETSFCQTEKDYSELLLTIQSKNKAIKELSSRVNNLNDDKQKLQDETGINLVHKFNISL